MINKNFLIIMCLFICLIFSLQAISAGEVENIPLTSQDDVDVAVSSSVEKQDVMQANENGWESLGDVPWTPDNVRYVEGGNFSKMNNAIQDAPNNCVLVLTGDFVFDETTDVAQNIRIAQKSLIIDAQGHTIDAKNKTDIFFFENERDGHFINLKNIVFKNAYNPDNSDSYTGGAVKLVGDGRIENCEFYNNSAGRAGAIYWGYANEADIINCIFEGNKALSAGGGAIRIRNEMANVNVENCTFRNNRANTYAGAIHFSNTQGSHSNYIRNCTFIDNLGNLGAGAVQIQAPSCEITDSRFINNTAQTGNGGAIFWQGSSGYVENCNFTNNTALDEGGAIYCTGTTSSVLNSNFTHNNASVGGAIYLSGANANVYHSRFMSNNAVDDGGALYCHGASSTVSYSYFKDNVADHGGAIRWENTTDGKIMNSEFVDNIAYTNAGAVSWLNSTRGQINNSNFSNNRAGVRGGAIRWSGINGTIFNSTFFNNSATNFGGAISWAEIAVNGKILKCNFTKNNATNGDGGALYWDQSDNGLIANTTFDDNFAVNGGAIQVKGTFCQIVSSNFTNDNATLGGSIYLDVGAYINDCLFEHEHASRDGGAIFLNASAESLLKLQGRTDLKVGLFDSIMTDCSAGHDGGAGYIVSPYGIVDNVTFTNCHADHDGGAGYVYGSHGKLINSRFTGNTAFNSGGAVMWIGTNGTVNHTNFTSNHALAVKGGNGDGGSILWVGKDGAIDNCNFNISTAKNNGGAVYISGNHTQIKHSVFTRYNATNSGGAVYVEGNRVNITYSSLEYGEANLGGAIYIKGDYTDLKNSNLTHNHARSDGGIIYIEGNHAVISDSILKYSYAYKSGGAIYIKGQYNTVSNSNLSFNNASSENGGSIYINGDNTEITHSNFEFGSAVNGGAIYIEGSNTNVTYSNFTKLGANPQEGLNTHTFGGSIYIAGNNTLVLHDNFKQTNAGSGGAIYITGSKVNITDSDFMYTLANDDGGAIYVGGVDNHISSSTFGFSNATRGGAIFIKGNDSDISSNFHHCFAKNGTTPSAGGAIYVSGDNNEILNSNFTITMAIGGNGGAIYVGGINTTVTNIHSNVSQAIRNGPGNIGNGGVIYILGDGANITKSSFERYNASDKGGGVYVQGNDVNISKSKFNYGNARLGGAIYINGNGTDVDRSNFTYNNAVDGGVMYISGDGAQISNSNLNYSYATHDGGSIYITGSSNLITKSNLDHNNASTGYGGSVYIKGANNNIAHSAFEFCTSTKGGAIYVNGTDAHVSYSNFSQNGINPSLNSGANSEGGTIYIEGDNTVVSHDKFEKSNADDGGFIYIAGDNSKINYSNFTQSLAHNNGGALYVKGGDAVIDNNNFKMHNATNGGAIYVTGEGVNITNSNFTINIANSTNGVPTHGGSIYVGGNDVDIKNCKFNTTLSGNGDGGAIYVAGNRTDIVESEFNIAMAIQGNGGAIYVGGHNAIIDVDVDIARAIGSKRGPVEFAGLGGCVYVSGENATIKNSDFKRYNATFKGGSIYIEGDNTNITHSDFEFGESLNGGTLYVNGKNTHISHSNMTHTHANHDGGAVYINGEGTVIDASRLEYSYSQNSGGAIFINGEKTVISKSNLTHNNASDAFGGSIYINGDNTNITGSLFQFCTSTNGGAIYVNGTNSTIKKSKFNQNMVSISTGNGGTIFIEGEGASISDSNFTQSKAYDGGIIYVHGGNANITHDIFDMSESRHNGGAIYIGGVNTIVSDSKFARHNATECGGAIYVNGENAKIKKSNFTLCHAKYGGVMYVEGNASVISGSNFTKYNATIDGGAVYVHGDDVNITHSYFEFGESRNGGSIYIMGENTYLADSQFIHNHASGDGGVIYIKGNNTNINTSSFDFSYSNHSGGAIYIKGVNTTVASSNFTFTNATLSSDSKGGSIFVEGKNTNISGSNFQFGASHAGGSIYIHGENATIEKSSFKQVNVTGNGGTIYVEGNHAHIDKSNFTMSQANEGGMIYIRGNNANISSSNFDKSTSRQEGGALYVAGTDTYVCNSKFSHNTATKGGAVYISGENTCIVDSDFNSTHASSQAGGIYLGGTNTTIYNSTFNENSAGAGGAIYNNGGTAFVLYSNFTNNLARGYSGVQGGAIFWKGGSANDAIVGSYFKNNTAINKNESNLDAYGGAIYWANGEDVTFGASVLNSTFVDNFAGRHGGAISWFRADDSKIDGCNFTNNTAKCDGGALYVGHDSSDGKNLTVSNCNFTRNHAGIRGGAVSNQFYNSHYINNTFDSNVGNEGGSIYSRNHKANLTEIINCTFINSTTKLGTGGGASLNGGAAYFDVPLISFVGCDFINCSVPGEHSGGAIYLTNNAVNCTVDNCSFVNSTAYNGGAIFTAADYAKIKNSNFTSNNATRDGGAIYISGMYNEISNSRFDNNSAFGYGGGAIVIYHANNIIKSSNFTNNSASHGGAVCLGRDYVDDFKNNTIKDSIFNKNHANEGGSVFVHSHDNRFDNITVANSTATSNGGGIFVYKLNNNITNSNIYSNLARNGAGLYLNRAYDCIISNTNISGNNATKGSGIYVVNSNYTLSNVRLLENQAHSNKFTDVAIKMDINGSYYVTGVFVGQDNLLNGIWNENSAQAIEFRDVTYWSAEGINTTSTVPDTDDAEDGINITVKRDGKNDEHIVKTDENGVFRYYFENDGSKQYKFNVRHDNDVYYTSLNPVATSIKATIVTIDVDDIDFGQNATVNVTLTDADGNKLSGTVNVTIGSICNFTIHVTNGKGSKTNVSGLPAGIHNATVTYMGNNQYVGSKNSTLFTVRSAVNITITKMANFENRSVGDIVNFTIEVQNHGQSTANNVIITDNLPLGLKYLTSGSNSTNQGVKSSAGGRDIVTWNIGLLKAGEIVRAWVCVNLTTNGTFGNIAVVNSTEGGETSSNITNVTVKPVVNLTLVKKANITGNALVGDLVNFTITVYNNGPSNATGVKVEDVLCGAFEYINATGGVRPDNNHKLILTIPFIANGENASVWIVVRLLTNGTFTNVAVVNSTETNKTSRNETSITVDPQVNLTVIKTISIDEAHVGDLVNFTIVVTNNGLSNATNVNITDKLPSGLEFVRAGANTTYTLNDSNKRKIIWMIPSIVNGTCVKLWILVNLTANGTFTNVAFANSTENSTDVINTTNITVKPTVNLTITKSVDKTDVLVGDEVIYTVTVTNNGPSNATEVRVFDRLDDKLKFVDYSATWGEYNEVTHIWTISNITVKGSAVLTIRAKVIANGTIPNVAVVNCSENATEKNAVSDNVTANPKVNLTIVKTPGVVNATVGDVVNFTIVVINNGPSNATNITIVDDLIAAFKFVGANGTYTNSSQRITWTIDKLANGSSISVWLKVRILTNGTLENVAVVNCSENKTYIPSNTTNITIKPFVNLTVVKTVVNSTANVGDLVNFTIILTNNGLSNATNINITDVLPVGMIHIDSGNNLTNAKGVNGVLTNGSHIVLWNIPLLTNGSTVRLWVLVNLTTNGTFTNVAFVNSTENSTNSSNSTDITVKPVVDLVIDKNVTKTVVYVGDTVIYTITVMNKGPSNATGVYVVDKLDKRLQLIEATASQGSYDNITGKWTINNITAGLSVNMTLLVKVLTNGSIPNVANVTGNENDTNKSNNNVSSENITVNPQVNLTVVKSVVISNVTVGDYVNFTITVYNHGLSNATHIKVIDRLNGAFEFVDAGGNYTRKGQVVNWTIPFIGNGSSVSVWIKVKLIRNGTFSNVATVNCSENKTDIPSNETNITAKPQVNLTVVKTITGSVAHVGDLVNFTIVVTNNGLSNATDVNVTDLLPDGMVFVRAGANITGVSVVNKTLSNGSKVVIWNILLINNGTGVSLWILVNLTANGTFTNVAFANSTENSTDVINTTNITVKPTVNLTITKSVDRTSVLVGDEVLYTVTVTNNGPSNATDVRVFDRLDSKLKFVGSSASWGEYDETTHIWTISNITSKGCAVLNITAKVILNGTISNIAVVNCSENATEKNASSDNVTANPKVNLTIVKTPGLVNATVGDIVNFTITVTNNGPSNATNITIVDDLIAAFKFIDANGTYTNSSQRITWTIDKLANGSSISVWLKVRILTNGTLENVAVVNCSENRADIPSNTTNITAKPQVNLTVVKSVVISNVTVGDYVNFTITVYNHGLSNATYVKVTDRLNDAFEFVTAGGNYTRNGQRVNWTIPFIGNGTNTYVWVKVRLIRNGTFSNVAIVNCSENKTDVYSNETNITAKSQVNLTVIKTATVTEASVGQLVNFTIVVINNGLSNATGVNVTDLLPDGMVFVRAGANVTGIAVVNKTLSNGSKVAVWNIPLINNKTGISLWILVNLTVNGTFTNVAFANSTENITNAVNKTNITVKPVVDLVISKNVTKTEVNVGGTVVYTITVKNNGPSNATGVYVIDKLDKRLQLVEVNPTQGSYDSVTGRWNIENITSGVSVKLTLLVKVLTNGTIPNVANVTGNENDTNKSNNNASSENITAIPKVNLTVVKQANMTNVSVGELLKFTITVTNNGPSNATNVNVIDVLDSRFAYVSGGIYNSQTRTVVWNIGNMKNNVSQSVYLVVRVIGNGTIENTVCVNSTENTTGTSNKTTVNSTYSVNLTVIKTADINKVAAGKLVNFTIEVTNNGISNASNVKITDDLNSAFEFINANGTYERVGLHKIVWTIDKLASGNSTKVWVQVRVLTNGTFTNIAAVHSTENTTDVVSNETNITSTPDVNLTIVKYSNITKGANVSIGDLIKFTIVVRNHGWSNATDVKVSDVLNRAFKFDSSNHDCEVNGQTVVWNIDKLDNSTPYVIELVVNAVLDGNYSNVAVVNSTEVPNKISNKTNVTILPLVNLTVVKRANITANASIGDLVNFTITVTNNGPSNATGIRVSDVLPDGMDYISSGSNITGVTGKHISSKEIIWQIDKLNSGNSLKAWVVVKVTRGGKLTNIVSVNSSENATGSSNKTEINVTEVLKTPIKLTTQNITYGDIENIIVTLPEGVTGTVNITVGDVPYDNLEIDETGHVILPIPDLDSKEYTVHVVYGGDGKYSGNSTSGIFAVSPIVPVIKIEVVDIWHGEVEVLNVTVNAPGSVNITVNGKTVQISLENGVRASYLLTAINTKDYDGKATWNILGLPVGKYDAFAIYNGNENYASVNVSDIFHVRDKPSTIVVTSDDIYVGQDAVINIEVGPKGVTGNVTVNVDGKDYNLLINDGKATLIVSDLKAGLKHVYVRYNGDVLYRVSENTTTFNVLKLESTIDIDSPDIKVGSDGVITVTVPDDAIGTITIEVDGKKYTQPIKDGKAVFVIPGLNEGIHDIKAFYSGDDRYLPSNTTGEINVLPVNKSEPDVHKDVPVTMHATGNPLLLLLVVVLFGGFAQIRRFRK